MVAAYNVVRNIGSESESDIETLGIPYFLHILVIYKYAMIYSGDYQTV